MSLDNNPFESHGDIAQFLEKFKEQTFSSSVTPADAYAPGERVIPSKSSQYERTFEKLEQKIQELEERFEASASQNQMILSELARTREAMERQKDRDAFLEHISRTIANLKASVENLSRARQERPSVSYPEPDVQRGFDASPAQESSHTAIYHYQPENYRAAQEEKARQEREEKERIISSLHQKASQLKAVNSALDREIKKVQQEKMEALKKSAEQAKEILTLRDQLTAAEERFKSFDFEGRIISIRQEYQQKVDSLETQLKEISDTCMKQVEEIESLRAENVKLHKAAAEKEAALKQLEAKEAELQALKDQMAALEADHSRAAQEQLIAFTEKLQSLQTQRDELSVQFESARQDLDAVRQEKELLEKNFKELVEKINANDAVIEELKQKIEVLGRQNEELTEQNARLMDEKRDLSAANEQLNLRAQTAERENEILSLRGEELSQANADLAARSEQLARDNDGLAAQAASLEQEKRTAEERVLAASAEKEALSQDLQSARLSAAAWQTEKAELVARAEELSRQMSDVEQERQTLAARLEDLAREKQDALEQVRLLSEEKETLSQHLTSSRRTTDDLSRAEAEASARREELEREKEELSARATALEEEKSVLAARLDDLTLAKEALARQTQDLRRQAETLTSEKRELAKENQQLRNQSAALLAARLVQEKERADKEETLRKAASHKPSAPLPPAISKREEPALLSSAKTEQKMLASNGAEEEPIPLSEMPVEINAQAKSSVMTEADLPEIKVAEPVPQHEQLFNGEDFLEKTDSFIGRMKWSIFREDK